MTAAVIGLCIALGGQTVLCGYLAWSLIKLAREHQQSQSELARLMHLSSNDALLDAATLIKSQTVMEKASHDRSKADTDARITILQESLEIEREKQNEESPSKTMRLQDGRVISLDQWSPI